MIPFADLNDNQRRAVEWRGGPLLVLAGPGSGKTVVLTHRVVRLLEDGRDSAALALTFTSKAAAEMRRRVDGQLGKRTDRARLCTFHAFATDVLGQHGSHLGLRPDFRMLTRDEDRIALLEEVIGGMGTVSQQLPEDRALLLRLVDRLFSESYGGNGPPPALARTPECLPALFRGYCDALVDSNRLDFGSLLHFANRLLRTKPAVARVVRLGWTHICVDEFQDTNRAQYDLLRLIAPDRRHNLFVVGDDDQIIYQWNGASPKRFDDLCGDYDLTTMQLPESYRCPAEIVERANRLIAYNVRVSPSRKTVAAGGKQGSDFARIVRHQVVDGPEEEARFVARDIRERDLAASDCAVLGRTNRLVRDAAGHLQEAGLEAFSPHVKSDFDSPVPAVLVEALRLANARHDRVVLRRMCRQWERLTGAVNDPHAVGAAAAMAGGDFLRAWADAAETAASATAKVALAAHQRIRADLVDGLDFPGIVDWFLECGWREWASCAADDHGLQEEIKIWRVLHSDIVSELGGGVTLNRYLQSLDMSPKTLPPPNAIPCVTVHRSKGLEFGHVYLIGMAQEVFPSYRALQRGSASKEMQEERRNCFVAITRARKTLTLTRARRYYGYPKCASQFLREIAASGSPAKETWQTTGTCSGFGGECGP